MTYTSRKQVEKDLKARLELERREEIGGNREGDLFCTHVEVYHYVDNPKRKVIVERKNKIVGYTHDGPGSDTVEEPFSERVYEKYEK